MELYVQAFVTVLSLMNPVVCGMIFESGESTRSHAQRLGDATKAAGGGFVRSTVQSFMGLVVMAMGVQIGVEDLSTIIQGASG